MTRLLCFGDLNADVTITLRHPLAIGSDTDGAIEMHGGGSAANVAAWAAADGTPTTFVGPVGRDILGDFLIDDLRGRGVDVQAVRRPGAATRSIAAIVGLDGNRSLVSDQDNLIALTPDDFDPTWFDDVAWLHLTGYTYIAPQSRDLFALLTDEAARRGIPCSIDPSAAHLLSTNCDLDAVRDAFTGVAMLFPSHDEAAYLSGRRDPTQAANALLELAEVVAVTCGAEGALIARRGHEPFAIAAASTEVTNTLGCGDAFAAGFLGARISGADDRTAAAHASDVAARAARTPSAR
jgi:sugar/nucleoside kinase (ribokinase family)